MCEFGSDKVIGVFLWSAGGAEYRDLAYFAIGTEDLQSIAQLFQTTADQFDFTTVVAVLLLFSRRVHYLSEQFAAEDFRVGTHLAYQFVHCSEQRLILIWDGAIHGGILGAVWKPHLQLAASFGLKILGISEQEWRPVCGSFT